MEKENIKNNLFAGLLIFLFCAGISYFGFFEINNHKKENLDEDYATECQLPRPEGRGL